MVVVPDPPFARIADVLIAYLGEHTGVPVDIDRPEDGVTGIRVDRVGGEDDGWTDYPRVQIASFAETYDASLDLGEQVRQLILVIGGQEVVTAEGVRVCVDYGRTAVPPDSEPDENPARELHLALYDLALRRPY